jgi:hypothetical protein
MIRLTVVIRMMMIIGIANERYLPTCSSSTSL